MISTVRGDKICVDQSFSLIPVDNKSVEMADFDFIKADYTLCKRLVERFKYPTEKSLS